jgi:hypothetical protein
MEGVEGMEKKESPFAWMTTAMPGVAANIADKRRTWGDAHVTQCLRRGLKGEPGWFFAREGVVAVGTPWDQPEMANSAAAYVSGSACLVFMRMPEGASSGAH